MTRLLGTARLVTLTGSAGVGKTRLALRIGARVARSFSDGVWLVELAELADPALVEHTIAQTLQVPEDEGRAPAELLARYLQDRNLLLVLDNCEHLVPACAELAHRLLSASSGLCILATSRQLLRVAGEQVYPVGPLPVRIPEAGNGRYAPAVELFVRRAEAVAAGFVLTPDNAAHVVDICARLDGNPLAIELAAVRLRALSVVQLAARLDDRLRILSGARQVRPAHQRTLRTAVDWSYQLCEPAEQTTWARVSVFAGGFDLESAEAVCSGEGIAPAQLLDLLDGLASKSILGCDRAGPVRRYRLLDTLRRYGLEKLRAAGDEARVRHAHARHYLHLAEQGEREWFGPRQAHWLRWAGEEHDNLRAALDFLLGAGDDEAALRLATALWFDWMTTARPLEGQLWLGRALSRPGDGNSTRVRGLWAASLAAAMVGDVAAERRLVEEARVLVQGLDDPLAAARILGRRAGLAVQCQDFDRVEGLARDALAGFAAAGRPEDPNAVLVLVSLAAGRLARADPSGAVAACGQAEVICRARQDRSLLGLVLVFLAWAEWAAGSYSDADRHGRQAVTLAQATAARNFAVQALQVLAWVAVERAEHERAATLLGASDAMVRRFGLRPYDRAPYFAPAHREYEERARVALGPARFHHAVQRLADAGVEQVLAYAVGQAPAAAAAAPGRSPAAVAGLTSREYEVAELVGQGLRNKDIARKLMISPRTVESHVERVLAKLGFTKRAQVATWIATVRPDE